MLVSILRKLTTQHTRKLVREAWRLLGWPRAWLVCLVSGLRWSPTWILIGTPFVRQAVRGSITIGIHWIACSKAAGNWIGVNQAVFLRTVNPFARIIIGDNVGMSGCTVSAHELVEIGAGTMIGAGALITDSDHHEIHPNRRSDYTRLIAEPVRIGKCVFVGARAIILKGVTIGEGAVVGAGAVVARDVPPYAIVVGNPARIVGDSRGAQE